MAVLDSYIYVKQPCISLCNYYENVWTVSNRMLQNGSAPDLASCCWLLCITHTGQLGRELRHSTIWRAFV